MCKAPFNSLHPVLKHESIYGLLLFFIIPFNSLTIFARFCLFFGGGGSGKGGSYVLVGSESCGYTAKAHDNNHASDVTTQCGFYVPSRF